MATAHKLRHAAGIDPGSDEIAPLIAGARARGMYDALEMVGQAAILLDADGRALAVTSAATGVLGDAVGLEGRHPASADAADDSRLQAAIRGALDGYESRFEIGEGDKAVTVRVAPVTPIPGQLLAAILLIFPCAGALPKPLAASAPPPRRLAATH